MIIMAIEGVLAGGDDLMSAAPTRWAKALYGGMRSQHHVVVLTKAEQDFARLWLKREHLADVSRVSVYNSPIMTWEQWKVDQVRGTLAEGWEVFFYVDTDPEVLAQVGSLGVCTLGVSYPTIPVGWKDVATPRSWSDVVLESDRAHLSPSYGASDVGPR